MDQNLKDYIKATTNLYGVIHKAKFLEIYNSQNKEQISVEDFSSHEYILYNCFASIQGDHLVRVSIIQETLRPTLKIQKGKPHFVPDREELLKYTDKDYFEDTGEFKELQRFLKSFFLIRKKAVEFSKQIRRFCWSFVTFHSQMGYYWAQHRFNIKNRAKAQEFLFLLTNLRYNTRAWEHNGHTLNELQNVVSKREIERLLSYGLEENYFPVINRPGR
ncbi:hypothetical protein [Desulfoscipio gibsoniae]|uniref:Uncharacterized protein n=1 Tax=Desulfoscipio gibsoniae DSM 7213 TaxID=767817 RepID=R4KKM6_9FIRM|nr:hypothetical protein [Desulfoscipio gibsoniae]AGL03768.1 hypothetical protein Desgi_4540 [Desulfoscipio gibsoniae DSM 7213]MDD2497770.1 hypothetical protein [Desulfitobacteriaceae bacterium]